jgi:putative oxidoreductase
VDVVMENAGGKAFGQSLQCVRKGGMVVVVGGHAGELVELDLVALFRREVRVVGSRNARATELTAVMDLIARKKLSPIIDRTLPMREAAEAHRILEARRAFGKVLLIP